MGTAIGGMERENWAELQRSLVERTSIALAVLMWLAWYREVAGYGAHIGFIVALLAGLGLALALGFERRLSAAMAAPLQVALSFVMVALAHSFLGDGLAWAFFVVPIVQAAFLLPAWATVAVSLAAVALLPQQPAPGLWEQRVLLLFAGGFAALLAREYRRGLRWAWLYAEGTVSLAREVRRRQEEVSRLNKALKVSNGLLRRSLAELALAQKEMADARQLKEQFATTVSHELRTPLSIILGFVDVMRQYPEVYGDVNWTPTLRRDLGEIQRSADYLSRLVDDILDLARIQALKMPIRREWHDIGVLVQDAVDLAMRLLQSKAGVRLETRVPPGLPKLYIDGTRIRQVLLNLLANACRFTDEGRILVVAEPRADEVLVSVSDTGAGIPADQLRTIFDEFRQAGAARPDVQERQSGGKGLGLAIAKHFVQMHGGSIAAESREGAGSTFRFSLPLVHKQVVSLAPPPHHLAGTTVELPALVVVDEDEGRQFLERHLEDYRVLGAADLQEARRLVHEAHPHAVIVNQPPEPEGSEFGAAPLILPEPVPVVSCPLPVGRWYAERDLFDDWLVKPLDGGRFDRLLERYPDARRILVADDDRAFVRLVRRMLEARLGTAEVVAVHDGHEALARLGQGGIDMALLDIAMPGLSGRAVARARRDEGDRTAIVAVTGLQPGLEGAAATPYSFSVTSAAGFSEEETLGLLQACLARLRPSYGLPELAAEPAAEPDARQAS